MRIDDGRVYRVPRGECIVATIGPGGRRSSSVALYDPDTQVVIGIVNMMFVKGFKEAVLFQPNGGARASPLADHSVATRGEDETMSVRQRSCAAS
jgi:hypothetical protein